MELKEIKQILQKYFDGESSEQEEQLLEEYFHSDIIAQELMKYRSFFTGISELSSKRDERLEEEVMDYILENENREKTHYRWLWQTASGIAAALVIALIVVNWGNNQSQWKDTYSDPEQAYAEATRTLQYVAGHYQKGIANLQPVKKIHSACEPLHHGLIKLEKGFQEMQNIEKINEKLKKQYQ